ncbi:MAG: hypothetical protein AAB131_14305, partial [Actinomycetota bacterium]
GAGDGSATCALPAVVDRSELDIPAGGVLPKYQHDLVLEFSSDSIVEQFKARFFDRALADPVFVDLLGPPTPVFAGPFLLFEFDSSEELRRGVCPLLEGLDFSEEPVSIALLDVVGP